MLYDVYLVASEWFLSNAHINKNQKTCPALTTTTTTTSAKEASQTPNTKQLYKTKMKLKLCITKWYKYMVKHKCTIKSADEIRTTPTTMSSMSSDRLCPYTIGICM